MHGRTVLHEGMLAGLALQDPRQSLEHLLNILLGSELASLVIVKKDHSRDVMARNGYPNPHTAIVLFEVLLGGWCTSLLPLSFGDGEWKPLQCLSD